MKCLFNPDFRYPYYLNIWVCIKVNIKVRLILINVFIYLHLNILFIIAYILNFSSVEQIEGLESFISVKRLLVRIGKLALSLSYIFDSENVVQNVPR